MFKKMKRFLASWSKMPYFTLILSSVVVMLLIGGTLLVTSSAPANHIAPRSSASSVKRSSTSKTSATTIDSTGSSLASPAPNTGKSSGAQSGNQPSSANHSQNSGTSGTGSSNNTPELILSTYNVTLTNLQAAGGQSAQVTVTSNEGPINQPTVTGYQKSVALENTSTPPIPTLFRNQWTYTIERLSGVNGGTDGMTFTAQTQNGKTISAHLAVNIEWTPSFTASMGTDTITNDGNGFTTVTVNFTINPTAGMNGYTLHYCEGGNLNFDPSTYQGCFADYVYTVTYNGNNNFTMTVKQTTESTGFQGNVNVHIWGDYVYGSQYLNWTYTF